MSGRPVKDITAQRFGRLVVQAREGTDRNGNATWTCLCDCGETTIVSGADLRRDHITTCGCGVRSGYRVREQAVLAVRVLLALHAAAPDGLTEREIVERCGGTRWSIPRALSALAEAGVPTARLEGRISLAAALGHPSGRSPSDPIPVRCGRPPDAFLVDGRWTTVRELAEGAGVSTSTVRLMRARHGSWPLVAKALRERKRAARKTPSGADVRPALSKTG